MAKKITTIPTESFPPPLLRDHGLSAKNRGFALLPFDASGFFARLFFIFDI
jgi:hypothetical protein